MNQMPWLERKWSFDFPAGLYPGIVERLRGTPARIADLIRDARRDALTWRVNEKWSINEHIGHLLDLDALDHARLADFVTGAPVLTAWDGTNQKTDNANYNEISTADILARFRAQRLDLVAGLEGLTDDVVVRTALHPRLKQQVRLVDWCFFVAEHDDHHLARMREALRAFAHVVA